MSFIIIDALLVSALHVAAGFQLMLYGLPDLSGLLEHVFAAGDVVHPITVLELALRTGFRPKNAAEAGEPCREARIKDLEEACLALGRLQRADLDAAVETFAAAKKRSNHCLVLREIRERLVQT